MASTKGRKRPVVSPETRQAAVDAYAEGMLSIDVIAKTAGVTTQTVNTWATKAGVPKRGTTRAKLRKRRSDAKDESPAVLSRHRGRWVPNSRGIQHWQEHPQ